MRGMVLLAAAALALAACSGDATGSGNDTGGTGGTGGSGSFSLTASAPRTVAGSFVTQNGKTAYICNFPVTVTATGSGSGSWDIGDVSLVAAGGDFNYGLTRGDVAAVFGSSAIHSGTTVGTFAIYDPSGPYEGTLRLQYYAGSILRLLTFSLNCT